MPPRSGDFALFGSHLCHFQRFLARISPMARPSWRANARQPSHISCARIMHTQTEPQHERDAIHDTSRTRFPIPLSSDLHSPRWLLGGVNVDFAVEVEPMERPAPVWIRCSRIFAFLSIWARAPRCAFSSPGSASRWEISGRMQTSGQFGAVLSGLHSAILDLRCTDARRQGAQAAARSRRCVAGVMFTRPAPPSGMLA